MAGRGGGGAREAGRCREASVHGEALLGRQRRGRGELSGRAARCPDSGFKPWCRRGASDRWGPLVSDFRIKIHPEGN
jgi:hypothetical protein